MMFACNAPFHGLPELIIGLIAAGGSIPLCHLIKIRLMGRRTK